MLECVFDTCARTKIYSHSTGFLWEAMNAYILHYVPKIPEVDPTRTPPSHDYDRGSFGSGIGARRNQGFLSCLACDWLVPSYIVYT